MKLITTLTLFFNLCICTSNFAQVEDGTFCPNFEAPDINGNMHNLYDLLADGYKVVLDISTTWCVPCWNYHDSGALEELYTNYGPDGTQEIFVLFIEAEEGTTLQDLQGTGDWTTGDWVTGTPYPIIDNGTFIAEMLEIEYIPTIYTVCSDGRIYESGQSTAEEHYEFATSLDCGPVLVDAALTFTESKTSFCEGPFSTSVDLTNSGTGPLTEVTMVLSGCDNCPILYSWSGNLSYFETVSIPFTDVEAASDVELVFALNIVDVNMSNNNAVTFIEVGHVEATTEWNIDFFSDCAPFDTSWEVIDEAGNIMAFGNDFPFSYMNYNVSFTLPSEGCYTVIVNDGYGNGLNGSSLGCPGGDGSFHCYTNEGTILYTDGSDQFEQLTGKAIAVPAPNNVATINESTKLNVYPNPFSDFTTFEFEGLDDDNEILFQLYNLQGNLVQLQKYHQSTFVVHKNQLAMGIYVYKISQNGREISAGKLTIK